MAFVDLHLSVFQPYDLHNFLLVTNRLCPLSDYFQIFMNEPERSKEFYYECAKWRAFVATRYIKFLRTTAYDTR